MDTTGALLGPLVAFAVLRATIDGYDAVFTLSGCVAALGVLVLLLFVPRHITPTGTAGLPELDRPTLRDALGLLRRPALRGLTTCAALLGFTTVSDSFLYLLLQREEDLPADVFPLLPLGTAAVFLLLAVPLGALADRISRRRLFLAGHGVLLLGYGLVLSPWHGIPAVAAVLVLHGTFYAATDGVLAAATAGAVPAQHQGAGQALVGTGQALARFTCSLAFGVAWSLWGGRTALAVTAAALAISALVASFVLRPADEVSP
jgi:predicted MFS family arabinose efflux permease